MTLDVDRLSSIAAQLVARVRDEDPEHNGVWLRAETSDEERWALLFVLAAAVPDEPHFADLVSWANPPRDSTVVDEVAVERACLGEKIPLTLSERRAAVAKMTAAGLSRKAIARVLGIDPRTVSRHRGLSSPAVDGAADGGRQQSRLIGEPVSGEVAA